MIVHHLTQEELRQVQLIQLEMLQEVDRICTLCGIHYNVIAGTLLGAVRHGDISLGMMTQMWLWFEKNMKNFGLPVRRS